MSRPSVVEIASWDGLSAEMLPERKQSAFKARKLAVEAVASGSTLAQAALRYDVDARTLGETLAKACELAPDGRPWGWRACIPYRVRAHVSKQTTLDDLPKKALPGAFGKLLSAVPSLETFLVGYSGALPARYRPSPAFESCFKEWKRLVQQRVPVGCYPLIAPDLGRRSCLEFLKNLRTGSPFVDTGFEVADAVEAGQFAPLFEIPPGLWTQYDGHHVDCDFWIEGEGPDGKPFLQHITHLWLLIGYDVGARLIVSWHLSFATNYSGVDFNRVCARSLVDWEPRDLVSPQMHYIPGSGIGTSPAIGFTATGSLTSLDNARAHQLHVNRLQLGRQLLGVINFGRAHVPEARAFIEILFKRIEECVIRQLPGGFRPGAPGQDKTVVGRGLSKDYPVEVMALHDLLDVLFASYNASALSAHQERSPLEVVRSHVVGGGWILTTSNQTERARNLSLDRVRVTIRGNRQKKRQPYVKFLYATYRTESLKNKWEYLGQSFDAVYDVNDMRYLWLYDTQGDLVCLMRAITPWAQSLHDLDLRRMVHRADRQGKIEIAGTPDAIAAYRDYLRAIFHKSKAAAQTLARFQSAFDQIGTPTPAPLPTSVVAPATQGPERRPERLYVPLSGPVHLGKGGG